MRYLSLFSGIGAFEKALDRVGIKYELVGFSEIDKYAIKSYCAVHGVDESLNLGDVSKIDLDELKKLGEIDLITHGSPCQDFSIAGRLAGGDKGSGTRSSLMWCTVDIVEAVRPKYVIWENVKNLLSAKNRHNFDGYIQVMEDLGYNSYYQVLNAKDYGIPQNRERVFTVSIRKDIDIIGFNFPEKQELKLRLKDMLEKDVDEKYYLDDEKIEKIKSSTFAQERLRIQEKDYCDTILARDWKDPKCVQIGKLDIKGHDCVKRVYSGEGISPTLTDMQGGNRQPKVAVAMRGRYNEFGEVEQQLEISSREIANSITTVQKDSMVGDKLRIRKLTPLECWRLMGFDDEDFYKAQSVPTSNTQLYKQAGNSIVVNVLEAIFRRLYEK